MCTQIIWRDRFKKKNVHVKTKFAQAQLKSYIEY